jgi:hypothetical protein
VQSSVRASLDKVVPGPSWRCKILKMIAASAIRSGVLAGQIVLFYDCWDCAAGMGRRALFGANRKG